MTEERNTEQELNSQTEEETVEEVFAENEASGQNEEIPAQEEQQDPMEQKVAELEGKLEEADNRYLRLQADFDNFRRRSRIELEASAKYRAQSIITDLLPAIDNFERALKMDVDNEQAKSLKQGVEMVYRSLLDALKNEGVEVIEAVGKEFDPHLHQAVMQAEDENYGPNIVVEEFQKGYMLKDRIIRPAMVKVNQ
ncbi:nucleotide exchange factor GrpE [Mesobacillus jeotgali]|uniref:Protein GrpE n=1 Tax=Mesobacillus jeotgali TaxID=129985 RepID=A0ABY9VD04_9BACI|nr:nucleotide exchange factor GrpE [Mesobacillus jeotgali]WNF21776.1 nucleotide exchange factor GrpE [Mesobacillus jeotgali]